MCTLHGVCAGVARRTLRLGKAWYQPSDASDEIARAAPRARDRAAKFSRKGRRKEGRKEYPRRNRAQHARRPRRGQAHPRHAQASERFQFAQQT